MLLGEFSFVLPITIITIGVAYAALTLKGKELDGNTANVLNAKIVKPQSKPIQTRTNSGQQAQTASTSKSFNTGTMQLGEGMSQLLDSDFI